MVAQVDICPTTKLPRLLCEVLLMPTWMSASVGTAATGINPECHCVNGQRHV